MLNIEQARFNMIEQQIRTWDVLDQRVLDLMMKTPREILVPEGYENLAFADADIPLPHGETMLTPKIVARMLQAVDPQPRDIALEVGAGTGYVTALLAKACRHVYSVEIHQDLLDTARQNLANLNIGNVTFELGDASQGWDNHRPYDIIVITGSLPVLPESFQHALNRGGALVAIVGTAPIMEVILIKRIGDEEWSREVLFETEVKPLQNARQAQRFVF